MRWNTIGESSENTETIHDYAGHHQTGRREYDCGKPRSQSGRIEADCESVWQVRLRLDPPQTPLDHSSAARAHAVGTPDALSTRGKALEIIAEFQDE